MSERSFLDEWDEAIRDARQLGCEQFIWRSWFGADNAYNLRRVAKTMHPSFMGGVPPKYDPRRDMPTSAEAKPVSENPEPHQVDTDRDRTNGHGAR